MVEVAGQEGAAGARAPATVAEGEDAVAGEAAQVLLRAQHGAPERVVAEGRPVDQVLGHRRGLVVGAVDLLDHDPPLAVELGGVEPCPADEIAQQVDRLGSALGTDGDVEGDQVVAGVRVQHAPEPLGGLVDVLVGRVLLAALEHEVLEEVGHPVLLGTLVAGPGVERQQHGQRACARELEAVHGHSVLGDGAGAHTGHAPATLVHDRRPFPGGGTRRVARLR